MLRDIRPPGAPLDGLVSDDAGKSEYALQCGDLAEARRYCDIAKDIAAQVPLVGLAANRSAAEGEVKVRMVYPAAFVPPAF